MTTVPANLLGGGVYALPEAAGLAGVKTQTARNWFLDKDQRQFLRPDPPSIRGRHAISFLDLIDLLVVGRFRSAGLSLQSLRKFYARFGDHLNTKHAFSHRSLATDGFTIFWEIKDDLGDQHLEEVLTGQKAFTELLDPFLQRVHFNEATNIADRWGIAEGVVIDPQRNFGKPISLQCGTGTFVLASAYHANRKNADLVADLYATTPQAVLAAVAFEDGLKSGSPSNTKAA